MRIDPAQDERALFDAWFKSSNNTASYDVTWDVWQAARAAPIPALTDEQILHALQSITNEPPARLPPGWKNFARAIERALKGEGK